MNDLTYPLWREVLRRLMAPSSREFETQSPEICFVRLPIRDDRIAQIVGVSLAISLAILAFNGRVSLWLSLAVVLMCLVASWKLFVPVRFELGPRGVIQASWWGIRKTPWREVSRYTKHANGVVLYLTDDDSPLAGFASIDLSCRAMQAEVESVVRFYMESRRLRTGSSIVRMVEPSSSSKA